MWFKWLREKPGSLRFMESYSCEIGGMRPDGPGFLEINRNPPT